LVLEDADFTSSSKQLFSRRRPASSHIGTN
jgi:hypothetical protein